MLLRISGGLGVLALTTWLAGGLGGTKSGPITVTTIVHDDDSGGAQFLLRSDDYNGTGEATYSSSLYNGAWYLDLYEQTVRTVYVTPNDAINSSQPPGPPPGYYWQNLEVAAGCYDQNLNVVPFENILTSSSNCKMIVDFGVNGTEYKLAMGPSQLVPGPATGMVTVTCNTVKSSQCVSWTIGPDEAAGSPNPTVANLYQTMTKKGSGFIGQYYLTFRIDVTNP